MTDQKMAENGALKVFDDFWNWRMSSTPEFATMVSYDWVVDYTYIAALNWHLYQTHCVALHYSLRQLQIIFLSSDCKILGRRQNV